MVKHISTFVGSLVVGSMLVCRMVSYRIVVVQMDFFVGVLTHGVGGVATKSVVDRMAPCFEMVDFDQCKWVELLLGMLTSWR